MIATLLARVAGVVEPAMLDTEHPLTSFISRPDAFSFIVAFLAGIAGILSLTAAKSGALIGVLISVTTVPAAGSTAVALEAAVSRRGGGEIAAFSRTVPHRRIEIGQPWVTRRCNRLRTRESDGKQSQRSHHS